MFGIDFTLPELFRRSDKDQDIDDFDDVGLEEIAHAQQKVEHSLSRFQAAKLYKRVSFYIFVAIWTNVLWGYENQAGGMVLSIPRFREDFGYEYEGEYVLEAKWQSAITAAPTAAIGVAYVIASSLMDKIGRRRVIMFGTIFGIPWITVEYVSTTIDIFFVGKLMNGFALGCLSACAAVYVSEISPLALRGLASALLNLAICVGPFICVLINNTTVNYTSRMAYRGIFLPQWIFSGTALVLQCFIPESPYWLLSKGRKKDALRELRRMFDTEETVQSQYALMKVTVDEATAVSAKSGTYLDLFRAKDRKRTALIIFAYVMQAFSGVSYVTNYSTYYYQLSGFNTAKSFQIACGAQALSVSGTLTALFIVDRVGRRPVIIGGMIALTILNLLIACTGLNESNTQALQASSGFLAMYNFIYNVGIGSVPYILGNEISSVFLRAKSASVAMLINNAFQCMWSAVLPYMFNPDEANMGSKINFIFTALSFVSVFVFYFFLPETAHRSFEEIDEMFAMKVPARHWPEYKTEKEMKSETAFDDLKVQEERIENTEK
uniref:MFS transporter n=1 Tax=Cyberlindnera americana TaxID=36016 RepID=A0A5P8N8B6_9ASCO|nr:MFS transporter [Cyberlindnera americana]